MKATIFHNPRCSKSREALAILEAVGAEIEIVRYLEHPPTAERLRGLYRRAGIDPRDGIRRSEPGAAAALAGASDDAVLAAMSVDPTLIERPIVETEKGVRLGRPPERIREIL